MWLIDTVTLCLEQILNPEDRKYAILSHTWEKDEVSFDDMADLEKARAKAGFAKISTTCAMARSEGLRWAWVDTCCIDKKSSAELTEAINSMFKWYQGAQVCYAYITDLPPAPDPNAAQDWLMVEKRCRWFTRGWTLQELIAPRNVVFYDQQWHPRGDKASLRDQLSEVTGIDVLVLKDTSLLPHIPVARRMSWASYRFTTRVEDMAYCLLGIFDVNMPMIYGEGRRAFLRLQEEIAKETNDLSLFAWKRQSGRELFSGLLAIAPIEFSHCRGLLRHRDFLNTLAEFSMTNKGVMLHAYIGLEDNLLSLQCAWRSPRPNEWVWIGVHIQKTSTGFVRARPKDLHVYHGSNYHDCIRGRKPFTVPKHLTDLDHRLILKELSERLYIRQEVDEAYSLEATILSPGHLWNPHDRYFLTMGHLFEDNPDTEVLPPFRAFQAWNLSHNGSHVCRCLAIYSVSRFLMSNGNPYVVMRTDQDLEGRSLIESASRIHPPDHGHIAINEVGTFLNSRYIAHTQYGIDVDWLRVRDDIWVTVQVGEGRQVHLRLEIYPADRERLGDTQDIDFNLAGVGRCDRMFVVTISVSEF